MDLENAEKTSRAGVVINQAEIKELKNSPTFSSRLLISDRTYKPFFYFKYHGHALEGFLGPQFTNAGISRQRSRLIKTDSGEEEFFCNAKLAKLFDQFELEGKYIKITYVGDEYTGYGHARKVYQVERFPVTDRTQETHQTEAIKNG